MSGTALSALRSSADSRNHFGQEIVIKEENAYVLVANASAGRFMELVYVSVNFVAIRFFSERIAI